MSIPNKTDTSSIDISALESTLCNRIAGEVRFDDGSRALYATDASNYRQIPIGVVIPRSIEDVIATVATAKEFGAPILSRGAGTSIAGQCCNAAIVMDFSKYLNKIIEIDPEKRLARVQPGVILDDLRNAAEKVGLTFGPDPATHKWCTLGGMIGNNSCGVHSIMAGRTVDNIESLDVLLYDGTRMNIGSGLIPPTPFSLLGEGGVKILGEEKAPSPSRERGWGVRRKFIKALRAQSPILMEMKFAEHSHKSRVVFRDIVLISFCRRMDLMWRVPSLARKERL